MRTELNWTEKVKKICKRTQFTDGKNCTRVYCTLSQKILYFSVLGGFIVISRLDINIIELKTYKNIYFLNFYIYSK